MLISILVGNRSSKEVVATYMLFLVANSEISVQGSDLSNFSVAKLEVINVHVFALELKGAPWNRNNSAGNSPVENNLGSSLAMSLGDCPKLGVVPDVLSNLVARSAERNIANGLDLVVLKEAYQIVLSAPRVMLKLLGDWLVTTVKEEINDALQIKVAKTDRAN